MSLRVALVVDNPMRDLPGLVLLAVRLASRGTTCHLVPFNLQEDEIWGLAPDFVLFNYLRPSNAALAKRLSDAGIPFGVLDTEGGVFHSPEAYGALLPQADVRDRVARFCSWGPLLAEHACRAGWFTEGQVAVTGGPRMDFYAPQWRASALLATAPAAAYAERPLVLINGIFALANPRFTTPEREVDLYVRLYGSDRDQLEETQRVQRSVMEQLVGAAASLSRSFPDTTFVYRPHPFENAETYEELLPRRENLHLVHSGSVDGWILRASALIHPGCSTAIEAGLAGVPALMPNWVGQASDVSSIADVSVRIANETEMHDTVEAIVAGGYRMPDGILRRLDEVVKSYFLVADGRAHERVADVILDAASTLEDDRQRRVRSSRPYAYRVRGKRTARSFVRGHVLRAARRPADWSIKQRRDVEPNLTWWDSSAKSYTAPAAHRVAEAILAYWPDGDRPQVGVATAADRGDYHFGRLGGRSVAVFPLHEDAAKSADPPRVRAGHG